MSTTDPTNFASLSSQFQGKVTPEELELFADRLGVTCESLRRLGIGRDDKTGCWTFPERDGDGTVIGIAKRPDMGNKHMLTGSKRGLTIAWPIEPYEGTSPANPILIVEGQSDTATGLDLGFTTIGRPSATGGAEALRQLVQGRDVVIVGENDDAGQLGAQKIADAIAGEIASIKIVYPPAGVKDLRAWKSGGLTREKLMDAINAAADLRPENTSSAVDDNRPEPRPLPSELPPVLPFTPDLLPLAFRAWIVDITERVQCPPDFPAIGAMVSLAGVVGRKVGIRPKRRDDWLVVPNLWGAVIGRPGIMKTPALKEPLRPLHRLEVESAKEFEEATVDHAARKIVADLTRKAKQGEITKAIKTNGDALGIAAAMLDNEQAEPVRRRYIVNDSSVEKLGELLNQNPNGMTCYRDELVGLLRSLDKEGQEGARAFYLEAWDGTGRYTYDRIGRGTLDIEAAIVSVIGGIQPGPLAEYVRSAVGNGAGNDGLLQRFQLMVYPDVSRAWVNVDRWPDSTARNRAYDVFNRLNSLDPSTIGAVRENDDPDGIPFLRFDDEAQTAFDSWRADLEGKIRCGEEHPAIESHLAKYRSLIPSLALLIHLADDGRGPVTMNALRQAIAWGQYLESHARRIYATAVNPGAVAAKALADRILSGDVVDRFALRDIYNNGWSHLGTRDDAADAAAILVDLDWLAEVVEPTEGRSRTRYRINPRTLQPPGRGTSRTSKSPSAGFAGSTPPATED